MSMYTEALQEAVVDLEGKLRKAQDDRAELLARLKYAESMLRATGDMMDVETMKVCADKCLETIAKVSA